MRKTRYSWPVTQIGRLMFGLAFVLMVVALNGVLSGSWFMAIGFGSAGLAFALSGWRLKGGARYRHHFGGGDGDGDFDGDGNGDGGGDGD